MFRGLRDRIVYSYRRLTKADLEDFLMERVERLYEEWNTVDKATCSCGSCDVPPVEWRIYNDHVLKAAAEWGVDQYTWGDADKGKVRFSNRCLKEIDWRANGGIYNGTRFRRFTHSGLSYTKGPQ